MTFRLQSGSAKTGTGSTIGLATTTIVEQDLAASSPPIDNCQIFAQMLLLGQEAGVGNVRFQRICSFQMVSGTLTQVDAALITIGTDYSVAALAGVAPVFEASGTKIRVRGTGVAAHTIVWTGYLWLMTGEIA